MVTMLTELLFFDTQEGRRNLETSILIILINSRTLTHEHCSVSVREGGERGHNMKQCLLAVITTAILPTCRGQLTRC